MERAKQAEGNEETVGHATNLVIKPETAGMVVPRVAHPESKTKAKEKARMESKPWARATAKNKAEKQVAKEEGKRGGAQMAFRANATIA